MRNATTLLQLLAQRVPPAIPVRHTLTLTDDGRLRLTLHVRGEWLSFDFDEADYDRPPGEIADDVMSRLKEIGWPSP